MSRPHQINDPASSRPSAYRAYYRWLQQTWVARPDECALRASGFLVLTHGHALRLQRMRQATRTIALAAGGKIGFKVGLSE